MNARRFAHLSSVAMVVLAVGSIGVERAGASDGTSRHLLPVDRRSAHVLRDAAARSETVAALIAELEQSDLLVLVRVGFMPNELAGDLRFVGTSAANRIVMVRVRSTQSPCEQVALLAHELQHAREISTAPEVRDEASLAAFARRIGRRTSPGTYETDAAVRVAWQVRRETSGR